MNHLSTTARGFFHFIPGAVFLAVSIQFALRDEWTRRDGVVIRRSERPGMFWSLIVGFGVIGVANLAVAMTLWFWR